MHSRGSKAFEKFIQKHGLSYAEVGRALHVSRVTIHSWANGKKDPTEAHRRAIARWSSNAVPESAWPAEPEAEVRPFSSTGTDT